jgi:hypothetical protein
MKILTLKKTGSISTLLLYVKEIMREIIIVFLRRKITIVLYRCVCTVARTQTPRPIREVLILGILSACPSVILTINLSWYLAGWKNDLYFYVIPMLYHWDSNDFFFFQN